MLDTIIYMAFAGLLVGSMFVIGQRDRGWIILTVPWSALFVGLPTALVFGLLLPNLPDPLLGLRGPWRAIAAGVAIGAAAGLVLLYLSRNPRRRRDIGERAGPVMLFALVGTILGSLWGLAGLIAA